MWIIWESTFQAGYAYIDCGHQIPLYWALQLLRNSNETSDAANHPVHGYHPSWSHWNQILCQTNSTISDFSVRLWMAPGHQHNFSLGFSWKSIPSCPCCIPAAIFGFEQLQIGIHELIGRQAWRVQKDAIIQGLLDPLNPLNDSCVFPLSFQL